MNAGLRRRPVAIEAASASAIVCLNFLLPAADTPRSSATAFRRFEIPRRDALNLERGIPGLGLRIRYDSPAGWTTYSPELTLDFVHHPDLEWHR